MIFTGFLITLYLAVYGVMLKVTHIKRVKNGGFW